MVFLFFCLLSSFTVERLTFNSEAEWVPSIALDDSNYVYIAYRYPNQIRYITNKTGSWEVDSIMTTCSVVSIAVTPAGTPHLAFEASDGDDEIYYATKVAGVWDIDTITNNTISSRCPSIALTPDSVPHIIYYDFEGGLSLRHADKEGGTWSTEVIPGTSIATYSSIAIDNNGNVHVAVVCGTYGGNREIIYANDTSGSWVSTNVTNDALDDDFPSIAVDNSGFAHISYEKDDGADWELWYAENTAGAFVAQQLTNNVGTQDGGYSSIAADGNGDAHIAYHEDHLVGDLLYLTNSSGSWETDTIFSSFSNKTYAWVDRNIAIDRLGYVHACFCNQLGGSGTQEVYHAIRDEAVGIESPSFYAATEESSIRLQWTVNMQDDCLTYIIARKSEPGSANYSTINTIPGSSSSPSPKTYSYRDDDVVAGVRYLYKLGIADSNGNTRWYGPISASIQGSTPLLTISPNPFTSGTSIKVLGTSKGGIHNLSIFDVSGRAVRSLKLATSNSRLATEVIWDGRDDRGKRVAPGVYICVVQTPGWTEKEKILLVR